MATVEQENVGHDGCLDMSSIIFEPFRTTDRGPPKILFVDEGAVGMLGRTDYVSVRK